MNMNFTTELKDTICSSCHCVNQKFLHHVWDGSKGEKICTSCVLFSNPESFCPSCFAVHDFRLGEKLIPCIGCRSLTHNVCFASNGCVSVPHKCSTCINPMRLVFLLEDLKEKGVDGDCKCLDQDAVELLLTAANIVSKSLSEEQAASEKYAWKRVADALEEKEKATAALNSLMEIEDVKNNRYINGPSLLDP